KRTSLQRERHHRRQSEHRKSGEAAKAFSRDTYNDRQPTRRIGSRSHYPRRQPLEGGRSIASLTFLTFADSHISCFRDMHLPPRPSDGSRNAYFPGGSQHRHYGTREPDFNRLTRNRQRAPAIDKTDI